MKKFINANKLISFFFGASLLIILLYLYSLDKAEWFPHAGDWFNVIFQIAIGYIINFIFYITQVYIPQQKAVENINKSIVTEIDRVIMRVNELFLHLDVNHNISAAFVDATDEQLLALLRGIDPNGNVPVINPRKAYNPQDLMKSEYTVKEWIISRVEFIERLVDNIRKYYPQYVTPELTLALDELVNSALHQNMCRTLLPIPSLGSFSDVNEDIFFTPYRDLIKRLIDCRKEYE